MVNNNNSYHKQYKNNTVWTIMDNNNMINQKQYTKKKKKKKKHVRIKYAQHWPSDAKLAKTLDAISPLEGYNCEQSEYNFKDGFHFTSHNVLSHLVFKGSDNYYL